MGNKVKGAVEFVEAVVTCDDKKFLMMFDGTSEAMAFMSDVFRAYAHEGHEMRVEFNHYTVPKEVADKVSAFADSLASDARDVKEKKETFHA